FPMPTRKQQLLSTVALDPEAMMDSALVRAFFGGKSETTFHRWRHHPDPERRFPPADMVLGTIPYWKRATVLAFRDRQSERSRNAQIHSPPPGTSAESELHGQAASPQIATDTPGQPSARFGG